MLRLFGGETVEAVSREVQVRLTQDCQGPRLYWIQAKLLTLLEEAAKRDLRYSDFLDEVLRLDSAPTRSEHLAMPISMGRFGFQTTLGGSEWRVRPRSIPR